MHLIHNTTLLLSLLLLLPYMISSSSSLEKALLHHLLLNSSSLDTVVRPVLNPTQPVNVTLHFTLIQILNLHEREQYIELKIWLRMNWTNELLTWDPNNWGGVDHTRVRPEEVWTPDVFLKEDVSEDVSEGPEKYKTPVIAYAGGQQVWMVPVKLQGTCIVDVKKFPFDQQVCKLVFTSWTHNKNELDLLPDPRPIVTSHYVDSSEWNLVDLSKRTIVVQYECCEIPYVDVEYKLTLQRKPLYYVHNLIVPCIIQMIIILFTFFLPPESGERIGVVITVLLVFAVYLQVLSEALPETSNSTPLLSHFFIIVMAESACSLITTCFIIKLYFKGTEKGAPPIPTWVRRLLLTHVARFVCVEHHYKYTTQTPHLELMTSDRDVTRSDVTRNGCQGVNNKTYPQMEEQCNGFNDQNDASVGRRKESGKLNSTQDDSESSQSGICGESGSGLLSEVQKIKRLIMVRNRRDEIEEEWQILAKVLDRLCFVIFLVVFAVSSFVIMVPVYHPNVI